MPTDCCPAATTAPRSGEAPRVSPGIDLDVFWYVLADSRELGPGTALARRVLDEPLVVFRDARGRAVALRDRCVHRNAPLSAGVVVGGRLRCGYHGWLYDGEGRVVEVPSLGPSGCGLARRSARGYTVRERDGYVYVRLSDTHDGEFEPFPMPHSGEPGWRRVRLVNRFASSVTNCAENFVDIPHTAYVHAGIFRSQRNERLQAWIVRTEGSVRVTYRNERRNLGWFAWFLNGSDREITHTDSFFMPNVTCVEYGFGRGRHLVITSQCVPVTADETLVYTDRAFRYGAWSRLATPVVRWLAQRIIDQDVSILGRQMEGIRRYGPEFTNTPADLIHVFIGSIRRELAEGRDPRLLPTRSQEVEFWV